MNTPQDEQHLLFSFQELVSLYKPCHVQKL